MNTDTIEWVAGGLSQFFLLMVDFVFPLMVIALVVPYFINLIRGGRVL